MKVFVQKSVAVGISLAVSAAAVSASLDKGIATSYTVLGTSIDWQTAGALQPASSGTLGPFVHVCAILEGPAVTHGNVMSRSVYVLDGGDGTATGSVVLHKYKRTDTITTNNGQLSDAESIVPLRTLTLSLTSDATARCFMAANSESVYSGTSVNSQASIVDKNTMTESLIQSYVANSGAPVSQISASATGIVLVTFGTGPNSGFAEFDDAGHYLAAGINFNYTVLGGSENATTFPPQSY